MNNNHAFFQSAHNLREQLDLHQKTIKKVLSKYEPYETAQDEIDRSISALDGIRSELESVDTNINNLKITTFFPLNLPLYSLVLFALIPSAFASIVYVRAPSVMQAVIQELADILKLDRLFPSVAIKDVNRSTFLHVYAQSADVIIFTGRYENAITIQKQCPHALMIFNGSGVNPAIVFKDANINVAADKIFEMRTFNSGQDCAGTDAVFVHQDVYEPFIEQLRIRLSSLVVGQYDNPATQIGPILKREYVETLVSFLNQERSYVIHEGQVNLKSSIVYPYIIAKPISKHTGDFHEFFAPVFYVLTFLDSTDVANILMHPQILDHSMYVSYFGNDPIMKSIPNARLLHNCIINDVEQGNHEYGGFGRKANFVAFGDTITSRPILISREIHRFYSSDGIV